MRVLMVCILVILIGSCKKADNETTPEVFQKDCDQKKKTIGTITDKPATVVVGATIYGSYLVEEGAIDSKLIPCLLPTEYMQHNLKVIITGEIKEGNPFPGGPCCANYFSITKIRKA